MLAWLSDPQAWIALGTLTALEMVLGIDNIIFISILCGKLPEEQRAKARNIGLGLAMIMRILLLLSLSWVMGLVDPLFTVGPQEVSGRDLILLLGGAFLIAKSTHEIHHKLEGVDGDNNAKVAVSFGGVLVQIALLDIVFSLDSVITAVGMADDIGVMVTAVVLSVGVMLIAAGPVAEFVENRPTVKMLALSFLLLIGTALVADGLHHHIPKGYIYVAMGFSVFVELLNLRAGRKKAAEPVDLRSRYTDGEAPQS